MKRPSFPALRSVLGRTTAVVVVGLGCVACSSAPKADPGPYCPMPSGYDLDNAIEQGLRTVRSCSDTYDQVFDTLLEIAATREDPGNKTKLYNFARTLADERVVPADRTREQFRRYFDADFVSIPDRTPSVAGNCRTLPQLKDELRVELQQKRLGFEQVMGDEEGFLVVQASHTRFVQAIETVCSTFDDSAGGW